MDAGRVRESAPPLAGTTDARLPGPQMRDTRAASVKEYDLDRDSVGPRERGHDRAVWQLRDEVGRTAAAIDVSIRARTGRWSRSGRLRAPRDAFDARRWPRHIPRSTGAGGNCAGALDRASSTPATSSCVQKRRANGAMGSALRFATCATLHAVDASGAMAVDMKPLLSGHRVLHAAACGRKEPWPALIVGQLSSPRSTQTSSSPISRPPRRR